MKIIITKGQVDLIKEKTNKSLNLIMKYYDIEDNGSTYRGDSKIQTFVTFYPKDYDNEMTREAATSTCNWKINEDNEPVFIFMTIPHSRDIPLMDYIGDTEDLEEYLEGIHKKEADVFVKRIIHRRNNPLKESVSKNKKFLTNVMGQDFTGKIKEVKDPYDVPLEFGETIGDDYIRRVLNYFGPLHLVDIDGKKYLYQYRTDEEDGDYEWFHDEHGFNYVDGEIPEQLGISDMGLRFKDIIDMFYNEGEPLKESVDKNKKFLINIMGEDLTGKIKEIKGRSDIPKIFHRYLDLNGVKRQIEMVGPKYLVKIRGKYYLYQDQSHFYQSHNDASFGEMFMDEDGKRDRSGKILKELGLDELGLKFSDIINIFYNEGKPLNEEYDTLGMSKENIKLKNLLKKVLENKELEYSFKDRTEGVWDGNDYEIINEDYTFKYHMIVNYVLGVGSGSVADIDVIIDDIIVDGESVYDGWVEIGYSQNAWYIDKLHDHLNDEFFNSFPFSIYPTFYGHNEER